MLESLFNKFIGYSLATLLKRDSNAGGSLWILQTLRTPISSNICEQLVLIAVTYCIENWIKLFREWIGLLFLLNHKITLFYLLLFVFICFITHCHSLSLIVIFCHPLSFAVIRCLLLYHLLSLAKSLVVIRCTASCHLLSLVVIRCHSIYHSSVFLQTIIIS